MLLQLSPEFEGVCDRDIIQAQSTHYCTETQRRIDGDSRSFLDDRPSVAEVG